MRDLFHLKQARNSTHQASSALRLALAMASTTAVDALVLLPLIAQAAQLEQNIDAYIGACQSDDAVVDARFTPSPLHIPRHFNPLLQKG